MIKIMMILIWYHEFDGWIVWRVKIETLAKLKVYYRVSSKKNIVICQNIYLIAARKYNNLFKNIFDIISRLYWFETAKLTFLHDVWN